MTVDELRAYGMERMNDREVANFLDAQRVGILGLPAEAGPLLRPMSFGFGGESFLFTFVLGEGSQKETRAAQTDVASFLVFSVESPFSWQSVSATGPFSRVPESAWDDHSDTLEGAWRPDVFESATADGSVAVYRLECAELSGLKHTGLPQGFETGDA